MKSLSGFLQSRNAPLISVLLFAVVFCTYLPSMRNGFVNFDDPAFVYANRYVKAGLTWEGTKWAFSTTERGFWHPLTWLSLMLDAQLFGSKAGGYHLTSLLLHSASTVILFLILRRLTQAPWRSAFVAALFGLHPLHVESVAWVTERKDVLSTLFWLLTMGAYARYAKSQVQSLKSKMAWYIIALALFACGLMSKAMLVTLPAVLLLLDYWPLRRVSVSALRQPKAELVPLLVEKLPFFVLSIVFSVVTTVAQNATGAVQTTDRFPIWSRIENALFTCLIYLYQMFWPRSLAAFYSYPLSFPIVLVILAIVALTGITLLVLWQAQRRPYLAFGWLWYLVTLAPVIGIIQVGSQAHADRYTYVPLIGIFISLTWLVCDLTCNWKEQQIGLSIGAAVALTLCIMLTREQVEFWKDGEALFRRALAVTKNNDMAHNNLGTVLSRQGKVDEAIAHFQEALRLRPGYVLARANLGTSLMLRGRLDEAIVELQEVIREKPDFAGAYRNLGATLGQKGRLDEAIACLQQAINLDPADAEAHYNLGVALLRKERWEDGIAQFQAALKINPAYTNAAINLRAAQNKIAGGARPSSPPKKN